MLLWLNCVRYNQACLWDHLKVYNTGLGNCSLWCPCWIMIRHTTQTSEVSWFALCIPARENLHSKPNHKGLLLQKTVNQKSQTTGITVWAKNRGIQACLDSSYTYTVRRSVLWVCSYWVPPHQSVQCPPTSLPLCEPTNPLMKMRRLMMRMMRTWTGGWLWISKMNLNTRWVCYTPAHQKNTDQIYISPFSTPSQWIWN